MVLECDAGVNAFPDWICFKKPTYLNTYHVIGTVLNCVACEPVFPLAHSAGIKLIPHGEVEDKHPSRGFRPQRSWGRNCRFGQRQLVNAFIHISTSDCVTTFPVITKLQSIGLKEQEGHLSKSTMYW